MGSSKLKRKPKGTRKRGRPPVPVPAKVVGAPRMDLSPYQRSVVDRRLNCGKVKLPDKMFGEVKALVRRAQEKGQGEPLENLELLDGDRITGLARLTNLKKKLDEVARFVTNKSALLIDATGKGKYGKYKYTMVPLKPILIEKLASHCTDSHVDYYSEERVTQSPIFTLFIAVEATSPIKFSIQYDRCEDYWIKPGEAFYFPSHRLHKVEQPTATVSPAGSPYRVAMSCHFLTSEYK